MEIKTSKQIRLHENIAISNMRDFDDKEWVAVDDIIKEITCPEVNDMETIEDAYDYLASKTNKIIDALQNNSKGASHSLNKGYEVNQK